MKLPDQNQLGEALRRWRQRKELDVETIAKRCERETAQIKRWEKGEAAFTYQQLVEDIFPAYEVEDFDLFYDFCGKPKLSDVVLLKAQDFTPLSISERSIDIFTASAKLKNIRTRIDRIKFAPGKDQVTHWGPHAGHEFVYVLKGNVVCCVSEGRDENGAERHELTAGMAIAFPSRLFHKFVNNSDEEAELVAAKPSGSGIAGYKSHEPV